MRPHPTKIIGPGTMDVAVVIGIYGISGSGKSKALSVLAEARPEWRCLEGSQVIEQVLLEREESMQDFSSKDDSAKDAIRNRATEKLRNYRGVTVVAGHCSFPTGHSPNYGLHAELTVQQVAYTNVFTKGDASTYSAILYLDKKAEMVWHQRRQDCESEKRTRPALTVEMIENWMEHEKALLQRECEKNGIYFALISDDDMLEKLVQKHVLSPVETIARSKSEANLMMEVQTLPQADVFLLIDGDRTLCATDTGTTFFSSVLGSADDDPVKQIFKRYPSYTFQAFLEVAMFYARIMSDAQYKSRSQQIGETVDLYEEWVHFLSKSMSLVQPVVVTSGNREIWKAALDATFGDDTNIKLIAGNHIGLDSYVVDSHAKALVVSELQRKGSKVVSFGDSGECIRRL